MGGEFVGFDLRGGKLHEVNHRLLCRRRAEVGMTMVVVTHEVGFARKVGDQLVFMDDGLVVERGDPREMIAAPKNPGIREFLSRVL